MRLVYLSLSWILGLYIGSMTNLHWSTVSILIGTSVVFCILCYRKKALLWCGICLVLLAGGVLHFQSVSEGDDLQSYRGFHNLRGVVAAAPDVKEYSTNLRIDVNEINVEGEWLDVSGTVMVYAPKYPDIVSRDFPYYQYGDLLQMEGILESPATFEDGDEFDFAAYLARQGIYSTIYGPNEIALVEAGHKSKVMELIYDLRRAMSKSLKEALPEPQCSLAQAMLLGERGSLSSEMREAFSRSGTSHLLAISGVHVGIVAGLILTAAIFLFGKRRPTYFIVALVVIWLYVMLSGMRPSAIRAATMGSLWLCADRIGRTRSAFTALAFAAAVMLAFDPRLLNDVGFQLSFTAMIGLIFLTPIFQNSGKRLFSNQDRELSSIVSFVITSFAVTLGAVLATLPLIAYYFHTVSLMSLPATFLTMPAIPGIIVTAALVGFIGLFASSVATVLGWISWLFIAYVVEVVELFTVVPFASVNVEVNAFAVCIYYSALATVLWLPKRRSRIAKELLGMKNHIRAMPELYSKIPVKWIALPLLVVAVLIWTAVVTVSDNRLHVFMLDVGQGDSVLLTKGNQQILIDGGPGSEAVIDELGSKLPFWDRNIELIVLTHPDSDHITGLVEVLHRYDVEKVLTSGQETDSMIYREWWKLIKEKGIEVVVARSGQQIVMDDEVSLQVVHPQKILAYGGTTDLNSNSVVLRLEYGNSSFLFTGDMGIEAEQCILEEGFSLNSTVLKVGHHGSDTSTCQKFIDDVKPVFAAISAGVDNKFGHPSEEVIERLKSTVGEEDILITAENGTIEFVTNGENMWVKTEK